MSDEVGGARRADKADETASDATAAPDATGPGEGPQQGSVLIRASLAGSAVFAVVSLAAVLVDGAPRSVAVIVALVMFALGSVAYLLGYGRAVRRSRADEISLAGLVFLVGVAPAPVRRLLLGSTTAQVVVALTAAALRPFTTLAFGILAPVFGLGLQCLWSARHGRFPPRVVARRSASPGSVSPDATPPSPVAAAPTPASGEMSQAVSGEGSTGVPPHPDGAG